MSDWWSKALGTQPIATPAPTQPVQTNQPWYQTTPQVTQPYQQQQVVAQEVPTTEEYRPTKAMSLRNTDTCPSCGSEYYATPPGMPNAMAQCFECGYNPRFETMGGGMATGIPTSGPAQAARGQSGGGFHADPYAPGGAGKM